MSPQELYTLFMTHEGQQNTPALAGHVSFGLLGNKTYGALATNPTLRLTRAIALGELAGAAVKICQEEGAKVAHAFLMARLGETGHGDLLGIIYEINVIRMTLDPKSYTHEGWETDFAANIELIAQAFSYGLLQLDTPGVTQIEHVLPHFSGVINTAGAARATKSPSTQSAIALLAAKKTALTDVRTDARQEPSLPKAKAPEGVTVTAAFDALREVATKALELKASGTLYAYTYARREIDASPALRWLVETTPDLKDVFDNVNTFGEMLPMLAMMIEGSRKQETPSDPHNLPADDVAPMEDSEATQASD